MYAVIINGSGTHGKDEFISKVRKHTEGRWTVFNVSTVDRVKQVCEFMDCPRSEKTDKARNFWSAVKDAWVAYNDGPTQAMSEYVAEAKRTEQMLSTLKQGIEQVVVFIHCREPEEVDKLLSACSKYAQVCTLMIDRPGQDVPNCSKDDPENVQAYDYDCVYSCRSLEELDYAAAQFVIKLQA